MNIKIACPKCNWEPHAGSLWQCHCGHSWNTFDTAGKCPNCSKIWEDTQCTDPYEGGCLSWSKHIDWYRNIDREIQKEVEQILEAQHSY